MKEIWIDIQGYEGLYQVSNLGRIKSLTYNKVRKPSITNAGYEHIILSKDGKTKPHSVHRLVALAFVANPNGYKYVNHKDENKLNNKASNLEWCTAKQNLIHSNVIDSLLTASHKTNEKAVLMYKDGVLVGEFDSISKAAQAINSRQQHVTSCLYGKQNTTRGYSFKFKNND